MATVAIESITCGKTPVIEYGSNVPVGFVEDGPTIYFTMYLGDGSKMSGQARAQSIERTMRLYAMLAEAEKAILEAAEKNVHKQ